MDQVSITKCQFREEQWRQRITECRSSGMSVKNWCDANGLCEQTYYKYLKKFRQEMCDALKPVVLNILSAAKAPKYDGKGNKTGNIMTGHILYREAEMTFSRKAFLKIFENKEFTQLVYR